MRPFQKCFHQLGAIVFAVSMGLRLVFASVIFQHDIELKDSIAFLEDHLCWSWRKSLCPQSRHYHRPQTSARHASPGLTMCRCCVTPGGCRIISAQVCDITLINGCIVAHSQLERIC